MRKYDTERLAEAITRLQQYRDFLVERCSFIQVSYEAAVDSSERDQNLINMGKDLSSTLKKLTGSINEIDDAIKGLKEDYRIATEELVNNK